MSIQLLPGAQNVLHEVAAVIREYVEMTAAPIIERLEAIDPGRVPEAIRLHPASQDRQS
ncbi:hypothetical protein RDV64_01600 [Acuticoccus sp. MNP-M23]|uniref:hypothetical protein n=1 Tax=Acuticoccus sp. MNP-M23 TaxID=3072793 RepID=UPI00281501A5|nr:hypothetical protein [Acuticoccus sp. MNP-M23]WMS43127.1 hypothetical protein RDV64_01600 [Acuticoccus sp. MNP-M23]